MHRKLFYLLNFIVLGAFVAALVIDQDREWKGYQKEFKRLQIERLNERIGSASGEDKAELERTLASVRSRPIALRQVMAPRLDRYDRCVTCHVGMDPLVNPSLTTPFEEHPYKLAKIPEHFSHDVTMMACTSCHQGQGLATKVEEAHGLVKHWEEPMLESPYIQGSCVRCHQDFQTLKGAEEAARGKQLIAKLGCVGCHSFNGVGGEVSVDLGDIADKPVARIDWAFTGLPRKHWNIKNWIELHLTKDPMELVPGDPDGHLCTPGQTCEPVPPSGMPPFYKELSLEEAQAITAYLMGMSENKPPADFFQFAPKKPEPQFASSKAHGQFVFEKYGCAACHGEGGAAGRRNFNARADGQTTMEQGRIPTLTKMVGTYSRDELRKKIQDGVSPAAIAKFNPEGPTPPLYMPTWGPKIKGKEMEALLDYLFSVAEKGGDEW